MCSTCCVAHKGFYKPNSRIEFEAEVAAQASPGVNSRGQRRYKKNLTETGQEFR